MTSLWRKWTSLVLVAALIVTMLPLGGLPSASAASAYFQFDNLSTDVTSPYEVTTNRINISGSFTGVSASSISYRIERIMLDNNGKIVVIESTSGTTTPIISNNDSTFLFVSVQIYEGLNRIVVTGTNSAGNTVEGEGFVFFANNPVISKVTLADGRLLVAGTPLLVSSANPGIMIYASNASEVTVNGSAAYSGSSGTFITTSLSLQPGYNRLEIVASNSGKTYTLTREVVYVAKQPTAYDVWAEFSGSKVSLDGGPMVYITGSTKISGKLAFPTPTTTPTGDPEIYLQIFKSGATGPVTVPVSDIIVGTADTSNPDFVVYPFEIKAGSEVDFSDAALGEGIYTLRVRSNAWGGMTANFPITFTNINSSAVYIKNIWRLYGANDNAGVISSSGRSLFTDNSTVNSMPLWLMLETANGVPAEANTSVTVSVNGIEDTSWNSYDAGFVSNDYKLGNDGYRIVKISNLPVGDLTLEFKIAGTVTTKTVAFTYDSPPAIRIENLFNGEKFTSSDGLKNRDILFTLVNFDPADYDTVTVTINGETSDIDPNDVQNGEYTFDVTTDLVPGPNTIIVAGTARGIPVSTMITVYYFSDEEPAITNILPVPKGEMADPDGLIERQGTTNQYVTGEEEIDILFRVDNFESVHVAKDGEYYASGTLSDDGQGGYVFDPKENVLSEVGNDGRAYDLRLQVTLPALGGSTSITISAKKGPVTVTHTVTITRVVPAYRVLSPKLPEEQVIKQNFVDVVIYAPGADTVELGKEEMTKDPAKEYYFRKRVTGLKVGRNSLKFSVYRGTQKVDGEIAVTYAADYKIGAQYVAELPSSGKVSVFGGNLQLTFPKNTYLKPAQSSLQVDSLFNAQQILFGIADRDGRTVKTYNEDGVIKEIGTNTNARNLLSPEAHFGFASQLYWIDPGYVDVTNPNDYKYVQGDHPYTANNMFVNRQDPSLWLKPTQRGTITIKYDEALRNEAANNLSIWRFDGNVWVNLGGKVDTGKKTVTTNMDGFGFYAVMILRYSYNDIIGHDYARNSLEMMFARGVMNKKNDNEFGVYDNITRGEFAQMLVKMLNLELDYDDDNLTFDDVPALHLPNALWDYRYIETAVRKGIVRGRAPRLFLPNEPLTREEAAVMIARATNLLKGKEDPEKDLESLKSTFTDGGLISYYAASSVLAVYKAGFITGAPNPDSGSGKPTYRFDPQANLKRADAAIIAERVMRKNKML